MSVVEAAVPPIPKGIFSMPAAEANGFPDQILNDPRIVGLDLGGSWADFERRNGVYDWSFVDSELAKAEAHGRKVPSNTFPTQVNWKRGRKTGLIEMDGLRLKSFTILQREKLEYLGIPKGRLSKKLFLWKKI